MVLHRPVELAGFLGMWLGILKGPQCPRFKVLEMFPCTSDGKNAGVPPLVLEKTGRHSEKAKYDIRNAGGPYFNRLVLVPLSLTKIARRFNSDHLH